MNCKDCKHEGQNCHRDRITSEKLKHIVPEIIVSITDCENFTPKEENRKKGTLKTIQEIELMAGNFVLDDIEFSLCNAVIINKAIKAALYCDKESPELKDIFCRSNAAIQRLQRQEAEVIKELAKMR